MIGRVVEITDDRRYLYVSRGFMVVRETSGEREKLGQIPLDDIAAIIGNAHGLSFSNNLLIALSERGTPFVVCGPNHNAVAMLWPVDGNFQQAKRYDAQIAATKPVRKRLWAEIVRSKLSQQASVLEFAGLSPVPLIALVKKVRSGDPDNLEAQGARRYWTALFGSSFRRDRSMSGVNSLLNYGYTVYRSAMARAVVAAGLHPTLGVHHKNEGNPMRLVDDLIEPFRPLVDALVWRLSKSEDLEVTKETKTVLVRSLYTDMDSNAGATPTIVGMQKLATSLAQVYLSEREQLELPYPLNPLMFAAALPERSEVDA